MMNRETVFGFVLYLAQAGRWGFNMIRQALTHSPSRASKFVDNYLMITMILTNNYISTQVKIVSFVWNESVGDIKTEIR